jgi:hypothetical protein
MRPLDGKKWSTKPWNLAISAGSKPGDKPRANSMAPTTIAVIATSAIGDASYRRLGQGATASDPVTGTLDMATANRVKRSWMHE